MVKRKRQKQKQNLRYFCFVVIVFVCKDKARGRREKKHKESTTSSTTTTLTANHIFNLPTDQKEALLETKVNQNKQIKKQKQISIVNSPYKKVANK